LSCGLESQLNDGEFRRRRRILFAGGIGVVEGWQGAE